jgi:tripartite-type tricarboxylate transporter receptor subunit TctC
MDRTVVAKLHDAMKDALDDPTTRTIMERFNMPRLYLDSAGYEAAYRRQYEFERESLRRVGMLPS